MSIISIQRDTNNNISIVRMQVSDTLATVSGTDYILNSQPQINALNGGTWQWFITDMILVAAEDGNAFYEFVDTNFATVVIFGQKGTGTVNPGLTNNIPYYAANGNTLSPLSNANNSVLVTGNTGIPGLSTSLPGVVQANITQVGVVGSGAWNATPVTVSYGGTGNTTFTAYSVICAGATATGAFQNVSGLGTTGYILTSNGAGALPTWQANAASGSVNPGTANDLAFYQTTGSAVSPLTTANSSVLVTSGLGVPSLSTTLPSGLTIPGYLTTTLASTEFLVGNGSNVATAVAMSGDATLANTGAVTVSKIGGVAISLAGAFTTSGAFTVTQTYTGNTNVTFPISGTLATTTSSLTTINADSGSAAVSSGAITLSGGSTGLTTSGSGSTVSITGTLKLANGGTNANLTASNGGIIYSTASAFAVLAGTATAGQLLLSGASTTPSWSTATFASTYAVNTLLYAGSSNTVSGLATSNSSILATSSGGVPAWTQSLPAAVQVAVGSLNSGTSASSSTFWRGDGTWAAPSGSGAVNSGTAGQIAYYAGSGTTVSGKTATITYTNYQIFNTAGTFTYTPTAGIVSAEVESLGAGGGSGGIAGAAGMYYSGAAAGAGSYLKILLTAAQIGASQTVVIGAGGIGGPAGNNNGTTGGATSMGSIFSCPGGLFGPGGVSTAGYPTTVAGGAIPTTTSGTVLVASPGQPSTPNGSPATATVGWGGNGGSTIYGSGGKGDSNTGSGLGGPGLGYGSGAGSGSTTATGGTIAGSNGAGGLMIIKETIAY